MGVCRTPSAAGALDYVCGPAQRSFRWRGNANRRLGHRFGKHLSGQPGEEYLPSARDNQARDRARQALTELRGNLPRHPEADGRLALRQSKELVRARRGPREVLFPYLDAFYRLACHPRSVAPPDAKFCSIQLTAYSTSPRASNRWAMPSPTGPLLPTPAASAERAMCSM